MPAALPMERVPIAQARGKIHDHFQLYYESDQAREYEPPSLTGMRQLPGGEA